MICNLVTFYNLTDYTQYYSGVPKDGSTYSWRGVEYEIDYSLKTGEIYDKKVVVGGSTYYYARG